MILVVDDEENIRDILQTALEMYGHRVRTASNGREALAVLASGQIPDLILLDLMMPVMNGWTLAEELQKNPAWNHIPIVVISAVPDQMTLIPQVQGVLRKPMDLQQLLSITDQYRGKAA